jgi:protein dithiol oxidoreductase (disulfide-forming)
VRLGIVCTLALIVLAGCGGNEPPEQTTTPAAQPEAPAPEPAPEQTVAGGPNGAPDRQADQRIELAQATAGDDALAAAGYENGVHYQRLSPTQPTSSSPDQIEVAEFFMYSCVHCYNFEPYVQEWLTTKPEYVNFVRVPTVWNPVVRLHGQAFYAAQVLGKGEEMSAPFFREIHVNNNYLDSEASLAEFFSRFGVDQEEFSKAFNSFSVHTSVERADELTRRYRITGTPSVVVNGKYVTTASMAGGYDQLMALVNALVESERAHN